jgi:hypothetical protein
MKKENLTRCIIQTPQIVHIINIQINVRPCLLLNQFLIFYVADVINLSISPESDPHRISMHIKESRGLSAQPRSFDSVNSIMNKKPRLEINAEAGAKDPHAEFRDWLVKNRCENMDQLEFRNETILSDTIRGTFATKNIEENGRITRIPAVLMMTSSRARGEPIGQVLTNRASELGLDVSNHSYLAAWLMYQRAVHRPAEPPGDAAAPRCCAAELPEGADQPIGGWGPYIRILPVEYDDPLWWTQEVLAHPTTCACAPIRPAASALRAVPVRDAEHRRTTAQQPPAPLPCARSPSPAHCSTSALHPQRISALF